MTYSQAVTSNNNNSNTSNTANAYSSAAAPSQGYEEVDFRDLMGLIGDKCSQRPQGENLGYHVSGLLEVEPLHFICHATSDGTRMERMDGGGCHDILNIYYSCVLVPVEVRGLA